MISSSEVEKKIRSLYTVDDIISAMKAYAGVTIRKTEELVRNIREYEESVINSLADITTHYPRSAAEGRGRKRVVAAFGSSQGLCGAFNEDMAGLIANLVSDRDALFVIGRRLRSSLESRRIRYEGFTESIVSVNGIQNALREVTARIMEVYGKEEYYELALIFTSVTGNRSTIILERILPPDLKKVYSQRPGKEQPFIYLEPDSIFGKVLEEFLFISLYRCFVESLRSENWHRMRSMEGASDAIKRKVSDLGSLQKYIRQEEITEEMMEILGSGMYYGRD